MTNFRKKYFSDFTLHEYFRGDAIFEDKVKIEYLYFIKEGEVELTLNINLFELTNLIKSFSELFKHDITDEKYSIYEPKQSPLLFK